MPSGRQPTGSEILDVLDLLERDPERRALLSSGYRIFLVCVDEGLVTQDSIDWLAQRMQELHREGLIAHGPINGGVREPPLWDGQWLQSVHEWRVTAAGRADAALYGGRSAGHAEERPARAEPSHDLFVCHAGEDKAAVAVPLAEALKARGWSVWLDVLELTLGDSLSGQIDAALARSRFGVVVLSRAFFAKQWPRRELAGFAAREVVAGTKVILPVWHGVDQNYLVQFSPTLADRLGASTDLGIEYVAEQVSAALRCAGLRSAEGETAEPVLRSVDADREDVRRLTIPSIPEERARLVVERPRFWEYLLLVGVLVQGKRELETKWDDHVLRLPHGARRDVDEDAAPDFLGREIGWVGDQTSVLGRILSPETQEQAFGLPGEPADPVRIENLARRLITMYESLLDWAAELRNATVPGAFGELREATACFVDAPIEQIRDFIDHAADRTSRLPELTVGATVENPVTLELVLKLDVDPAVQERHRKALRQLERERAKNR
jgi:hypothetical protein